MVNLKINRLPKRHIVDRYLQTVEKLGVKNDGDGLDYFISAKEEVDILNFFPNLNTPPQYIAFAIGAAHTTKRLPTEKIIEICQKVKLPVLLLGGKEDVENGQLIESQSIGHVVNLCGKLTLNQSASVVRQSAKVVTHDTGLMHIAAAFRKDIISVWGNTIPDFGMVPYVPDESSTVFEVRDLKCRPCSKIGFGKCPQGHFKCMEEQNTEEVAAAVNG